VDERYLAAVNRIFSLQVFGMKLGLTNIERMLRLFGNPRAGRRTVLVGGTNGKGSISAMLASIARTAGLRTGLFTSPHLVSFTERIQINGERITHENVVSLTDELWSLLEPYRTDGEPEPTTFFEALTAFATAYFHRQQVELGVIEVGLGGRLDATNALPRDLVVIADMALDHCDVLGDSLAQVVAEKAALFRANVPVVASGGLPGAAEMIAGHAVAANAPLALLDRDYSFTARDREIDLHVGDATLPALPVPLAGRHQWRNTATAVRAALALGITDLDVLRRGLRDTTWPGRLEEFPGAPQWLLDCAHNPAGAQTLVDALPEHHPTVWLCAVMHDKDIDGILDLIAPQVDRLVCTTLPMPRAAKPEDLAAMAERFGKPVTAVADTRAAMDEAARQAGPGGRVLVAGSIFLVGFVRGQLTGEQGP